MKNHQDTNVKRAFSVGIKTIACLLGGQEGKGKHASTEGSSAQDCGAKGFHTQAARSQACAGAGNRVQAPRGEEVRVIRGKEPPGEARGKSG